MRSGGILIGITQYLLYMKLLTLLENSKHLNHSSDVYGIEMHVVPNPPAEGFDDLVYSVDVSIDIKQYETFTENAGESIRSILQDIHSLLVVNYKVESGFISFINFTFNDRLNEGGSRILIGRLSDLLNYSREIVIGIDTPEEDIDILVNTVKKINFPTGKECMTRLKKDHTILKASTSKLDVKDINVELSFIYSGDSVRLSSIGQVQLGSLPEGMDEEELGLQLSRKLKPYKIRPQINSGPVIGTSPL
jgi:hypothetical protein